MKSAGQRIAVLTAYDFPSAVIAERAGLRVLLVGDSLGMVVQGHDTTLPVTIDDMVRHAASVVRGSKDAMVIADLPFLSYATVEDGVRTAGRLMQEAGVQAVKLEGGKPTLPVIRRLVELGIPVMGISATRRNPPIRSACARRRRTSTARARCWRMRWRCRKRALSRSCWNSCPPRLRRR